MSEQRHFQRAEIDVALTFVVKGNAEVYHGHARDLSIGGMFVETTTPAPFHAEVVLSLLLPGAAEVSLLPGRVRWGRAGGMGVQFGLLGAKETHLIAALTRR